MEDRFSPPTTYRIIRVRARSREYGRRSGPRRRILPRVSRVGEEGLTARLMIALRAVDGVTRIGKCDLPELPPHFQGSIRVDFGDDMPTSVVIESHKRVPMERRQAERRSKTEIPLQ